MVALFGLPALLGVVAVLGVLAAAAPRLPAQSVSPATAGLCLLAGLLGLSLMSAGGTSQLLDGAVAIDPLAAFFLVLPSLAGFVVALGRLGQPMPGVVPGFVGAALLVILAADARVAILAVSLFALACWGWQVRMSALVGIFVLAGALVTLSAGTGSTFAAMRASPPGGWQAVMVLVLTVLGVAPLVGWAPWHRSSLLLPSAGVPVTIVAPTIGLYLAVRILADLCGSVTPGWWALPLLLVAAASAGLGVMAALRAVTFPDALAGFAVQQGGWMLAGLGVAIAARSADVLPLATLALGGAMLHALSYTLFGSLALLTTEAAAAGAGSQTLDRLGGLAARMPAAAVGMLVSGLNLAFLPLTAGFASFWLLLQALLAAPRVSGLPLQLVVMAAIGMMALSAGFGTVAAIRVGGVAFLGRPRTPRAAAAEDLGAAQRAAILGLAVLCSLIGLFPGIALRLVGPAQHWVTAAGLDGQGGWTGVRTQLDLPGYAPLGIALLLAAGLGLVAILRHQGWLRAPLVVPAWEDGFTAPPAWMPFGDPSTQVKPDALSATLPAMPILPALPRVRLHMTADWPSIRPLRAPMAILALAVLLLVAVTVLRPA